MRCSLSGTLCLWTWKWAGADRAGWGCRTLCDLYLLFCKSQTVLRIAHENKWTKNPNRHFSRGDTQMANKHLKRYSASLMLGKCTSNPHWDATLRPLGWLYFYFLKENTCQRGCGDVGTLSCTAGGNVKCRSHCREEQSDGPAKSFKKWNYHMMQQLHS